MSHIMPKRVAATITRDIMDSAGVVCYEHEIPIYQAVHGEDNVRVLDAKEAGVEIIQPKEPLDARAEFARLEQAFGMHHEINVSFAEYVYGRKGENFVARCGGEVKQAKSA